MHYSNNIIKQIEFIIAAMNAQFETRLKRTNHRQRFYSSMNYEEYCDLFGPPSPLFKPQEDPTDDIPLLQLENQQPEPTFQATPPSPLVQPSKQKMETIPEIDGSENFTQNLQRSPRVDLFDSHRKSRETRPLDKQCDPPKRVRLRMRSQSDNSEYLIFNFLERFHANGHKKQKREE